MLAELVWLLIFGVLVSLATVLIKIFIEFPGLLRLKCIYTEDTRDDCEDRKSHDLEKSRELDVAAVLARYDGQVEKNIKCKVQSKDNEDLRELRRVRRQKYKDKQRAEYRVQDKLKEETTNDEERDISIEIDESRAADPEIPPQLLIKVGKKVRLGGEVKSVIEVERDHHHHKHGHVRQH